MPRFRAPRYRGFCSIRSIQLIGSCLCGVVLGACGSLPTSPGLSSLPIPPDSANLQPDSLPSPQPTPLSLSPQLRSQLQISADQPVILIERRGEDVIAQIPAQEVMRWIGAAQLWPGFEGLDLRLTVGETYRETATAQLRMEQAALFTFSTPPEGTMVFEATAFSGINTVAEGQLQVDSEALEPAEGSDSPTLVPLMLDAAESVPVLQGISLAEGDPLPIQDSVIPDPIALEQPIILTGQNLNLVSDVLFATVFNPSGMTTRSGEILSRSPDSLTVVPPEGLALASTTISVQSSEGLGLGSLNVTWKPEPQPSPSSTASPLSVATPTPTPILNWRVENVLLESSASLPEITLEEPTVAMMDAREHLLIADRSRHQVLVLDADGYLQPWAGNGEVGQTDDARLLAQFHAPVDLAWGIAGELWVVDQGNHQIRKITSEGQVITVAGTGEAGFKDSQDPLQAQFNRPSGVAVAPDGSLFVADSGNHRIRHILPTGEVRTLAGTGEPGVRDGPGERAQFYSPVDLVLSPTGLLWVADRDSHRIRQITPERQVRTVAGSEPGFVDGDLEGVQFNHPTALALTEEGSLLIADRDNHRIRRLSESLVSTLAGSGQSGSRNGVAAQAQFRNPLDLGLAADGSILVVDEGSIPLRRISPILPPGSDQLSQTP